MGKILTIGVFTGSESTHNHRTTEEVELLGKLIIQRGHSLVFGGSFLGQMGLLAQAAHTERERLGGKDKIKSKIIGVTHAMWEGTISPLCDRYFSCSTLIDRFAQYQTLCDAFIAIGGGLGTYTEMFFFLESLRSGSGREPVHVIEGNVRLEQMRHDSVSVWPPRDDELPTIIQTLFEVRAQLHDIAPVDYYWFNHEIVCVDAEMAILRTEHACENFYGYFFTSREQFRNSILPTFYRK